MANLGYDPWWSSWNEVWLRRHPHYTTQVLFVQLEETASEGSASSLSIALGGVARVTAERYGDQRGNYNCLTSYRNTTGMEVSFQQARGALIRPLAFAMRAKPVIPHPRVPPEPQPCAGLHQSQGLTFPAARRLITAQTRAGRWNWDPGSCKHRRQKEPGPTRSPAPSPPPRSGAAKNRHPVIEPCSRVRAAIVFQANVQIGQMQNSNALHWLTISCLSVT